jgi:hypothetical protein
MTNFSACHCSIYTAWKTPRSLGGTKKHVIQLPARVKLRIALSPRHLKAIVREAVMKGPQEYVFTRHPLCSYNTHDFNGPLNIFRLCFAYMQYGKSPYCKSTVLITFTQ